MHLYRTHQKGAREIIDGTQEELRMVHPLHWLIPVEKVGRFCLELGSPKQPGFLPQICMRGMSAETPAGSRTYSDGA